MEELTERVTNSLVTRYLRGKRCTESDVAEDVGLSASQVVKLVASEHGSYESFVQRVMPKGTKTVRCRWCRRLMQVHRKTSRGSYCLDCQRARASNIILYRIRKGRSIRSIDMLRCQDLSWIVLQSRKLWGVPYRDVLRDEFAQTYPIASGHDGPGIWSSSRGRAAAPSLRSIEDRNLLVEANLGLVGFFVDKFLAWHRMLALSRDDFMQEGILGLIRAAEMFDANRGVKFSSYACWWIQQCLERACKKRNFPICIPARINLWRIHAENLNQDNILVNLSKVMFMPSLDDMRDRLDSRGEAPYTDLRIESCENRVDYVLLKAELSRLAQLHCILERDLCIFWDRVFLDDQLDIIGKRYSLSRERIRQIVVDTTDKLKSAYVRERGCSKP